jgi:hypothetical protein
VSYRVQYTSRLQGTTPQSPQYGRRGRNSRQSGAVPVSPFELDKCLVRLLQKASRLKIKGFDAWNEKSDRVGDYIEKEGRKMYNGMPVWYPATKAIEDNNVNV